MAGAASSSSSSENYDVFLSFRGEDTRRNFVSHLYTALLHKQIRTYKDNITLEKGDEVWPALVRAIENSYICIVVFSKHYASSTWCLNELTQILHCKQEGEIIPVFYEIKPRRVRHQTKSYQKAFEKHEKELDEKTVAEWKASLKKAANFSGFDSQSKDYSDDSNFIEEIVKKVLQKLSCKYPPNELPGLIGIKENIRSIESLLQKAQTIGIWGMGGIGKTTLARAVFDKHSRRYDGCCFLANVREESGKHGLHHMRKQLLSKLLDEKDITGEETSFAISRLKRQKVLIVLDDVNDSEQLEHLIGDYDCLRSDSRLIVTTRDKEVLICREVQKIYKVYTLEFEESIKLFSMKAFSQNHPKIGFEELTRKAVDYAGGIPLAFKVLGLSLRFKSRKIWESALGKLEKHPNMKIQNVLRLSYDGLDCTEKKIFLDIACFFKGEDKDRVKSILDACDFYTADGIKTLINRALITLDYKGKIDMHDLIEEMGKEIVREESNNELGKYSRLWDPKDVYDVLQHNKESNLVEGMILDMSRSRDLQLNADTFTKMCNLRFFKVYYPWRCRKKSCKVYIPSHTKLIFNKPSYFQWDACPLQSLPSTFCLERLVELHMPESHVEKLWDGVQDIVNLRIINLCGSKRLIEFPHLSNSSKLELINLGYCENLCNVDLSNLCLPKLNYLVLSFCIKLESLLSEAPLESLMMLYVQGCSSLKEFSLYSEEIMKLDLRQTAIEILPPSIGKCSKLESLYLPISLKNLPDELSKLRSLRKLDLRNCRELDTGNLHIILDGLQSLEALDLSGCCNLSHFPHNLGSLSRLRTLTLDGSSVESLPASITYLSQLRDLSIQNCSRLQHLLELPPSIQWLNAKNCENLHLVNLSISGLPLLYYLDLSCCLKLESLLSETPLKSLWELHVEGCSSLKEFSLCAEEILILDLRQTIIEILPSSIGKWSKLEILYLPVSLKNLPNELSKLRSLRKLHLGNRKELDTGNLHIILDGLQSLEALDLSGCCNLSHFPYSLGSLSRLRILTLDGSSVESLPASITYLSQLGGLSIQNCSRLHHLPQLPPSIQWLKAKNCENLHLVDLSISDLPLLCYLDLSCCLKLKSLLSEAPLKSLWRLNVEGCSSLKEFSLCSKKIMELDLRETTIEILPSSIGKCSKLERLYLPVSLKNLPDELSKLRSLQQLHLGNCKELDIGNLHIILDGLQSLEFLDLSGCCTLPHFPHNLGALSRLRILTLDGSSVESLPASITYLSQLRDLSIQNCSRLQYLPELPPSIQWLNAKNYENLCLVDLSISDLPMLFYLDLSCCLKLKSLLSETPLKSLRVLNVDGCSSLKEFSLCSEEIMKLDLRETSVEILSSSIGKCSKLESLYLPVSLKNLPNELSKLRSLQKLNLVNCKELDTGNLHIILDGLQSLEALDLSGHCNLSHFPHNLGALSRLGILTLDGSNVESLPTSITYLSQLRTLSLQYCWKLKHLLELPPSIQLLKANNCVSLENVSPLMELKVTTCRMDFQNCVKLDQNSLFSILAYLDFIMKQKEAFEFHFFTPCRFEACFPGNKIPRCFLCRATQRWITIEIPSCFNLRGFAFCIIISPNLFPPDSKGFIISCKCYFANGEIVKFIHIHKPLPNEVYFDSGMVGMISYHVYLWYQNYNFIDRLKRIEEKANNQWINLNQKVFIEFSFYVTKGTKTMKMNQMIKECGVCPTFHEKEHNLDLNMDIKTEGCWDIDDYHRKKFKAFKLELELGTKSYSYLDIDEFESSTIKIEVDCTGFDHVCLDELQMLDQRKELKEFIFQPLSADCCKLKSREDVTELNLTCLMHNWGDELQPPIDQLKELKEFFFYPLQLAFSRRMQHRTSTQMNSTSFSNGFNKLDKRIQDSGKCQTDASEFQNSMDQMELDLDLELTLGVKSMKEIDGGNKLDKTIQDCRVLSADGSEPIHSINEMRLGLGHKSMRCENDAKGEEQQLALTINFKQALAMRLELVKNSNTCSYDEEIEVGGSQHENKNDNKRLFMDNVRKDDFLGQNLNGFSELIKGISDQYQNVIDQTELALEADKEQQLHLTNNFKVSSLQTAVPIGLELDLNTEARTNLDIKEIEVGSSYHENQQLHFKTKEFISQPHTTRTEQNDGEDLGETFSCGCFIGFLWKRLRRSIINTLGADF